METLENKNCVENKEEYAQIVKTRQGTIIVETTPYLDEYFDTIAIAMPIDMIQDNLIEIMSEWNRSDGKIILDRINIMAIDLAYKIVSDNKNAIIQYSLNTEKTTRE